MKVLFIDNYDSFTYNVLELLRSFENVDVTLVKNDELGEVEIEHFDKLIISPGPDLPKAASGLMSFLKMNLEKIPTLGICLGHQAIAEYFGGTLLQYSNPKHGEKCNLSIKEPGVLFEHLPNQFEVGLYHSWYVNATTLPAALNITAQNDDEIIMALQHDSLPIYSVQFHPESYMSELGEEILQNFIRS